ncbi:hypothetical protein Dimus_035796, partial [Dionaea muscipula]
AVVEVYQAGSGGGLPSCHWWRKPSKVGGEDHRASLGMKATEQVEEKHYRASCDDGDDRAGLVDGLHRAGKDGRPRSERMVGSYAGQV